MVRLMLVLAPVACILSAIALSETLKTYMRNLDISRNKNTSKKQQKIQDANYPMRNEVCIQAIIIN